MVCMGGYGWKADFLGSDADFIYIYIYIYTYIKSAGYLWEGALYRWCVGGVLGV